MRAPVLYLDQKRQIRAVDSKGRDRGLTATAPLPYTWWKEPSAEPAAYAWPSWSPDGRHLAAFRLGPKDQPPQLVVISRDGVETVELAALNGKLPIYLQWQPDGQSLAYLVQVDRTLVLSTVGLGGAAPAVISEGTPMFSCPWQGGLAVFQGLEARTALRWHRPDGRVAEVGGMPGQFCTPVPSPHGLVYVSREDDDSSAIRLWDGESDVGVELHRTEGLVALIAGDEPHEVLVGVAPGGDGSPYREAYWLDLRSGATRRAADGPFLSVFPAGAYGVVTATVDTVRNLIVWRLTTPEGGSRVLASIRPSRDLAFLLRFFEQYAKSHPIVDPVGGELLIAGALEGQPSQPIVWRVPLGEGVPERVGEGLLGAFSAR